MKYSLKVSLSPSSNFQAVQDDEDGLDLIFCTFESVAVG